MMFVSPIFGSENVNREMIFLTQRDKLFEEIEDRLESQFYKFEEVEHEFMKFCCPKGYQGKVYNDPNNTVSRKKLEPALRNAYDIFG